MRTLGVVMAGGRNTRYGGLKAFAEVGGQPIVQRVVDILRAATDDVVVVANDQTAYAALGLPMRSDVVEGKGALGGLLTALRWSSEAGFDGVFTMACDMPFASAGLAQQIRDRARREDADVVAPESGSRRGLEPLFAWYANACLAPIEDAIARNDHRMISFHDRVRVARLPIEEVRRFGEPTILFMNVNTPEELAEAQRIEATHR